jgi:hypothetical protein
MARRVLEQESAITDAEFDALKLLVEEDDEDLFTYFEEYVERAGPHAPPQRSPRCTSSLCLRPAPPPCTSARTSFLHLRPAPPPCTKEESKGLPTVPACCRKYL